MSTDTRTEAPGRHDFDFLHGRWTVQNRRLRAPLELDSDDWVEFVSYVTTQPLLGGLGNLDKYLAPAFPEQAGYEAIALRLFDPGEGVWRIWWASTGIPGNLDVPVVGGFTDGHGVFECDDVVGDRAVVVRYEWILDTPAPRWQQSFSFDRRTTFKPNWIMVWNRE